MARLQRPEIIVHNEAKDGTLRDAAMERNIPAITVEVGNPLRFQSRLIKRSRVGLLAILKHFGVIEKPEEHIDAEPVICGRSYWIYAQHGGLISVLREPTQHVEAGQEIARVHNVFGDLVATYCAPVAGVVVGRATNPICRTGSRILHLGVTGEAVPALSTTSSDDPGSR
jgi:hypothetical protein